MTYETIWTVCNRPTPHDVVYGSTAEARAYLVSAATTLLVVMYRRHRESGVLPELASLLDHVGVPQEHRVAVLDIAERAAPELQASGAAKPTPAKVVVNVPKGWKRPKDASKSGWAENHGHWETAWKKHLTGVDPSKSNGYTWLGGFIDRGEIEMTVGDIVVHNVSAGPTRGSQVDRLGFYRVSAEGLVPLDREGNPSDEAHYFAWRTAIFTVRAHAEKLLVGGAS